MNPVRGLKRLVRMVFSKYPAWNWSIWPKSVTDREALDRVGDGTASSTVMAPVLWVCRTFPEAPPALWRLDGNEEERQLDHPMLRLLQRPNPFFTGPTLWMATMASWLVSGEAFWLKLRNGIGAPAELWWAPNWTMEPKGDERTFITHYEYKPAGASEPVLIRPEDVIHFRFGIDPSDGRRGYSPLKSVLREIYTDDEAALFTAAILKNMGVPGLIVSPADAASAPKPHELEATKAFINSQLTGDKRGEPLVMSGPTKVEQFGFSPEQLMLRELRRIPEERVTAVLGVPAIVAGLGAGLDRSTFTNMAEAREAAYESGIIPTQRIIAEDIRFDLLAEFEDPFMWRFGFDLAKVRVLQEDLYRQHQRHDLGVRGGWEMVGEARRAAGLELDEARDNIFLRPMNTAQVDGTSGKITPLAPAKAVSANGNGGGGASVGEIAGEVARELERRELAKA